MAGLVMENAAFFYNFPRITPPIGKAYGVYKILRKDVNSIIRNELRRRKQRGIAEGWNPFYRRKRRDIYPQLCNKE